MRSSGSRFGLRDRLRYRFDLLLSSGTSSVLLFLGLVTLAVVTIGSLLLTFSGQGLAGSDGSSLMEDFWQTMLRTIDAGTMAGDTGWGRRVLALLVTLFGILVAGTLIGLIASGVEQRVEEMQRGRSVVVESDHVVVLGSSPRLPGIVDQLTLAARRHGGRTIVVLADEEPRDLAEEVRTIVTDRRRSRLVFRRGDPTRMSDLALVGVSRAREVIVLADDDAGDDARPVTATLAVGAELGGFAQIPIVVELMDVNSAMNLAQACGGQVHPVVPSQAIARLTAFALGEPGLSRVVEELLDFEGSSIYLRPLGDLVGVTFGEVVGRFTTVRPIGLMDASGAVEFNPDHRTVLRDPNRLIVVADDDGEWIEAPVGGAPASTSVPKRETIQSSWGGRTLVIGWNGLGAMVLQHLRDTAAAGSGLEVVYDARLFGPEELDISGSAELELTITPTQTDVWRPADDRSLDGFTTIVLLANRRGCSADQADSRTLLTLMSLAQTLERADGVRPRIVAELVDARNVDLARMSGADDFIVSDALASRLLAQLAELPERRSVYLQLYATGGSTVHLVEAGTLGVSGELSWADVVARAYAEGSLAIGWRRSPARGGELLMNPDTAQVISVDPGDQVVVIG